MLKNRSNLSVYHGSFMRVVTPDLAKCQLNKDFGRGFYVTSSYAQASKWASIKKKQMEKMDSNVQSIVSKFVISDFNYLSVLEFEDTDSKWFNYILNCRRGRTTNRFDVVIGKVADSQAMKILIDFENGRYARYGGAAIQVAIRDLKAERLQNQLCFLTPRSLEKLHYIQSYIIKG